jgi:hypothetical protein
VLAPCDPALQGTRETGRRGKVPQMAANSCEVTLRTLTGGTHRAVLPLDTSPRSLHRWAGELVGVEVAGPAAGEGLRLISRGRELQRLSGSALTVHAVRRPCQRRVSVNVQCGCGAGGNQRSGGGSCCVIGVRYSCSVEELRAAAVGGVLGSGGTMGTHKPGWLRRGELPVVLLRGRQLPEGTGIAAAEYGLDEGCTVTLIPSPLAGATAATAAGGDAVEVAVKVLGVPTVRGLAVRLGWTCTQLLAVVLPQIRSALPVSSAIRGRVPTVESARAYWAADGASEAACYLHPQETVGWRHISRLGGSTLFVLPAVSELGAGGALLLQRFLSGGVTEAQLLLRCCREERARECRTDERQRSNRLLVGGGAASPASSVLCGHKGARGRAARRCGSSTMRRGPAGPK